MLTFIAESYLHRLDPVAIDIAGVLPLRWYGLSYATGFLIAWLLLRWFGRTGRSPLRPQDAGDFMFALIAGVLVGGRLGYAIFYDPQLLIGFSGSIPFWDLLAINKGGMASHGGIVGVIIATWIFGRRHKLSRLHLFDLTAFTCCAGLFLGRLANFVNGELWGKALPEAMQSDPPAWSVKYPTEIIDVWLRTAQNGEPGSAAVIDAVNKLDALEPLRDTIGGTVDLPFAVVHAAYAGNETVIERITPMLTAYYPSQIIQAITDGPMLMAILAIVWLGPRKPGVVGSWFLIAYAGLRIASEFFRQPDLGVKVLMGLSRGQLLSVLMLATGIVCLLVAASRRVDRMGGLLRPVRAGPTAPPDSPEPA